MQVNTIISPNPLGLRRVVITGLGLTTPLGVGVAHSWGRLLAGESGVRRIDRFSVSDLSCQIAGLLPEGVVADGGFDPLDWVSAKELKKMDPFIVYGISAASQAINDAGWTPSGIDALNRTGVSLGSGIGGLPGIEAAARGLEHHPKGRLSPFFIPSTIINLISGHIAIQHGFRGPNVSSVTACASGAHAIADAARLIASDDADVMIAGGAEGSVCELSLRGFCAARALSSNFNNDPTRASRPWDTNRDGFVMGEGAGVLVLEEYEHALKRGAFIYAEIIGYGMSGDAHHIVSPPDDGDGAARAMEAALRRARLAPEAIDYVNAHATSTSAGDRAEIAALKRVFGHHLLGGLSVSSTKSSIGHLLGASGSVEAIFSILAIRDGVVPPTLNLDSAIPECEGMDLVPMQTRRRSVKYVLSNSFGFGGTNIALVFGPPPFND